MVVRRFYEPQVAQASYLIGCAATGEAIVIDPSRDIAPYLAAAAAEGVRITHVTETHIHADYLSGSRELAAATGARLYLSDEGDAAWKYAFASEGQLVRDGDRITIGNIRLDVVATPGHTPEHLAFLVTDGAAADRPIAAVTGDFLFVGDVGRPDLLERAANMRGTMEAGARTLWRSLARFRQHEDWLQIWPGHGAGSACGKGISAIPQSTLGYERHFNWAFRVPDEDAFVAEVLAGQPEPPAYFATMKRLNKEGPRVLGSRPLPTTREDGALPEVLRGGALVIDTRPAAAFAQGHVPGTLSIPFNGSFTTWAGWLVPYTAPFYLIADDDDRTREIVRALTLIGLDDVAGVFRSSAIQAWSAANGPLQTVPQMTVSEARQAIADGAVSVVDVRGLSEWEAGHLAGATHIPLGYLASRRAELPAGHRLLLHCKAGGRSMMAAGLLQRLGVTDIVNLVGGYDAWTAAGAPVTTDAVSTA